MREWSEHPPNSALSDSFFDSHKFICGGPWDDDTYFMNRCEPRSGLQEHDSRNGFRCAGASGQ